MQTRLFLIFQAAAVLPGLAAPDGAASASPAGAPRPNIVVILSDDMGWSDLGCYGGEIATPHLDSLATGGVKLTQFYNTGRCCPTRASLLTGLYPHQAGIGHMMSDQGYSGYTGELNRHSLTLAEALRPAGYTTLMCGKWHVTKSTRPEDDPSNWPVQRGFDRFYGTITGAGSFYDPSGLCRQNTFITPENDTSYQPEVYYYTDALADNACAFLKETQAENPEKPFLLYLAFTAAHWPLHALPEDIARAKGKYDSGYGPARAARLEKLKKLGMVRADTGLSPQAGDWDGAADKQWEARCMEVYAAMIHRMDRNIGKMLAELKDEGRLDNTLICFLQDNGGCAEAVNRDPQPVPAKPDRFLPMGRDGLQLDGRPRQTRDGWPVRGGTGTLPGPADTYISYGRNWANVSNTPFREYKHWVHEGGISTPLILSWPAGISQERRNSLESAPAHLIDIMATCLDLAGAVWPKEKDGQAILPPEGMSLRPVLSGNLPPRPVPLFWEHEGNRAVRDGSWKLVAKEDQPWELYDIFTDRTESHDLSEAQPEKVKTMAAQWDTWAARAEVLPLGAWKKKRGAAADADEAAGSAGTRFSLKSGDQLKRREAPLVVRRGFSVAADVNVTGKSGVIAVQGGSTHGWALYLEDGHAVFALRRGGKLTTVSTGEIPSGDHQLRAGLTAAGELSLAADGGAAVTGKAPGPLNTQPKDGLDIGRDTGGFVGAWKTENAFPGTIREVVIDLDPPAAAK